MATKNKKWGLLYKIVSAMTLALPISITLVVSAIWSKPSAEMVVIFDTPSEVSEVEQLSDYFVFASYDDDTNYLLANPEQNMTCNFYYADFTTYDRTIIIDKETNPFEVYLIETDEYIRFIGNDIDKIIEIKVDDGVYMPSKVGNVNIETGSKLSLSFIISVIATLIVVAIISGKMRLHRKYPKSATFIALLGATIIIGVINTIIGNILTVFIVATISWGAYCLENYYYNTNIVEQTSQQRKTSDLAKALRELDI